jgi:hypothetical protein
LLKAIDNLEKAVQFRTLSVMRPDKETREHDEANYRQARQIIESMLRGVLNEGI